MTLVMSTDNEIGDEFHYLMCCSFFLKMDRRRLLSKYYQYRPNVYKVKTQFICS